MRASPTLASLGPYSTLTLKSGCQVPSGYHYHLLFQNRLVGNRHVTFFFKVRPLNFFFSWIKVFSWKLLCKVNESRIYPVYEAKKLAPLADSLIRFRLPLGTITPTLTPYSSALPTPGPPKDSREQRWKITASKN